MAGEFLSKIFHGAEDGADPLNVVFAGFFGGKSQKLARYAEVHSAALSIKPQRSKYTTWITDGTPDAAIANDNALGLNQSATHGAKLSLDDLSVHHDWQAVSQAVNTQMGEGIRRRAGDAYVVLVPDEMEAISFDAYAQKAVWDWIDSNRCVCTLSLPEYPARLLGSYIRQIKAGLVAFQQDGGPARLLAIWINDAGPISLGLDSLPRIKSGVGTMMERFAESTTYRDDSELTQLDTVALYFERALEATLAGIGGISQLPPRLIADAEALGLSQVLDAERVWRTSQSVGDALRLAYLLSAGRNLARGG